MVTKAVSMDIKLGGSNRTRPQDGNDGGFSDVLGSVGKESGKRQQSLGSPDTGVQRKDFGKEFRFTEKAADRPARDDAGRQPGLQGSRFDDRQPAEAQAADDLLTQAAELVTQTIRETGEKPDKAEAAEMLGQALKSLKSGEEEEAPEDTLIDALMQVFAEIAGEDVPVTAEAVFTDNEMPVGEITADMPVMNAEIALTADIGAETQTSAEFAEIAEEELPSFDEGLKAFVGESVQKLSEGRLSMEAAAADLEPDAEPEIGLTQDFDPRGATVEETVKMLGDLLEEAKEKLGLSEVKVEHIIGDGDDPVPMMRSDTSHISHKMFGKDSTGELDHILNGTRFDVSEDDDKTGTETYDAVRMASELMQSRTDTDIPVEDQPMFPEKAQISPPEVQTAEQILDRIQHMQDDHTEFTMVLNPESLGRITVKIAAAGERISVEITADDPRTGAMLAARNEGLQSMLRESGVQLEKCQVVSEHEDTQFNEQSYDGSSKNPYSRDDKENHSDDDDGDGQTFYDLLQTL